MGGGIQTGDRNGDVAGFPGGLQIALDAIAEVVAYIRKVADAGDGRGFVHQDEIRMFETDVFGKDLVFLALGRGAVDCKGFGGV